jgi:hypothetical protein
MPQDAGASYCTAAYCAPADPIFDFLLFIAAITCEPVDWGLTFGAWAQGDFSVWDFVGLLPLLSSQADDVGDALGFAKRTSVFGDVVTPWGRKVFQRGDIDWHLVRPDGLTNLDAAAKGYAPMRKGADGVWEGLTLHHLNQDPDGPFVELWQSTHNQVPHKLQPPPSWRKVHPDKASAYARERPAYWRWRALQVGK